MTIKDEALSLLRKFSNDNCKLALVQSTGTFFWAIIMLLWYYLKMENG